MSYSKGYFACCPRGYLTLNDVIFGVKARYMYLYAFCVCLYINLLINLFNVGAIVHENQCLI